MTPEEMRHEQRAGPRALVFGCLFGIVFWAVVLFGVLIVSTKADHKACSHPVLSVPRTVTIRSDVPNPQAWRNAIATWNAQGSGMRFVEVDSAASMADVYIISSARYSNGSTWVRMPCGRTDSVVYAGTDVDLDYWAAHELGHTVGLADHITHGTDPSRYINPKYCPEGYSGVMSYCTPRWQWWGPDDRYMLWWWF